MMYSTPNALREIYMDGSFCSSITIGAMGILSDLNRFPSIFLFHKCCNVLERASIRTRLFLLIITYEDNIFPFSIKRSPFVRL